MSEQPNWEVQSCFQFTRLLGKGTYGSVYEAIDSRTDQLVAIKKLKPLVGDDNELKYLLREIAILDTIRHPNIVQIHSITCSNILTFDPIFIVMEKCYNDLKNILKSQVYFNSDQICWLFYQAACAVNCLHSANILHRDIKPGNILINQDYTLKICDFGQSRTFIRKDSCYPQDFSQIPYNQFKSVKRQLTGHVITRWYRAPEVILLEKEYTEAIDIWSLGCVFTELLTMNQENCDFHERTPFFPGSSCFPLSPDPRATERIAGFPSSENDQLRLILNMLGTPQASDLHFISDPQALHYIQGFPYIPPQDFQDWFPGSSELEIDLLQKMLVFNPFKRISITEVLNHPYFANIRDVSREQVTTQPLDLPFDRDAPLTKIQMRHIFQQILKNYS